MSPPPTTPGTPTPARRSTRTTSSRRSGLPRPLLGAGPNVKYIVVVGGDDIVPFARVPDETEIANERTYRESLGSRPTSSSARWGGLPADGRRLEARRRRRLPRQRAVRARAGGRPPRRVADGHGQDDRRLHRGERAARADEHSRHRLRLPRPTAQRRSTPFAAGLGTNAKSLINDTWDRDSCSRSSSRPVVRAAADSLNAHFDHHGCCRRRRTGEPPTTLSHGRHHLARINAMAGRLGFSIGCHSGLAVSTRSSAPPTSWRRLGAGDARPGAVGWIGNTGYGLGDTTVVAYSERLHALFSRKLDGTMTDRPGARPGEAGLPRHLASWPVRREGHDADDAVRPADAEARDRASRRAPPPPLAARPTRYRPAVCRLRCLADFTSV